MPELTAAGLFEQPSANNANPGKNLTLPATENIFIPKIG